MDAGEDTYLQGCRTYKHAGGVILYPFFKILLEEKGKHNLKSIHFW
jgi:hypothetical protein